MSGIGQNLDVDGETLTDRALFGRDSDGGDAINTGNEDLVHRLPIRLIQRFAPRESRFDLVPVTNVFLTDLPAEINQSTLPQIRKVAQSLVGVFEENAHLLDLVN